MNRKEYDKLQIIHQKLNLVFDLLESQSDSDLDYFEEEADEIECAPLQYSARQIMQSLEMIEAMMDKYEF